MKWLFPTIVQLLTFVEESEPAVAEYGVDGPWRRQLQDPLESAQVVAGDSDVADFAGGSQPLQGRKSVADKLLQGASELHVVNLQIKK